MTAISAWNELAQLGPFRWDRVALSRAGRVALGVAAPLIVGWMSGYVEYGAFMALGALPAGFASLQGETRSRLAAVALASFGMAVSTFVGGSAAAAPWLLVPIIALWGYGTGLSVCLGPLVSVAVLQWVVALLIAVGLPLGPSEAALRAGLVFAGGLLQALLVVISWTVRTGTGERRALAMSYSAMAVYASNLAAGASEPPPPTPFAAGKALDDPNPFLPRNLRLVFADLLEEAECIRISLAALAATHHHVGDPREFRAFMVQAAGVLDLIAGALNSPRVERDALLLELDTRVAGTMIAAHLSWRWSGEALLGQLRAAVRLLAHLDAPTGPTASVGASDGTAMFNKSGMAWALATLRANMTTTTEAGRHALRLAVVAALMEAVVQAMGLYQGRWATLTVFLVLKPDYRSTMSRGVQRALGTALGATIAAVVVHLVHTGQGGLVAAAVVSIAGAYALFDVNYLLYSVLLTIFILVLLVLLDAPAVPTAEARIFETVAGAALALLAYFAWPTWEGASVREKFAGFIEAHRDYAVGLLRELAHSGTVHAADLRALQAEARRARSNVEAAMERLTSEPKQAGTSAEFAQAFIAAASGLAHSELALHALALHGSSSGRLPIASGEVARYLDDLSAALDVSMGRIAAELRTLRQIRRIPPPRLINVAKASGPNPLVPLVALAARLVDATDTLEGAVLTLCGNEDHQKLCDI